jgi:hypothetical protein
MTQHGLTFRVESRQHLYRKEKGMYILITGNDTKIETNDRYMHQSENTADEFTVHNTAEKKDRS